MDYIGYWLLLQQCEKLGQTISWFNFFSEKLGLGGRNKNKIQKYDQSQLENKNKTCVTGFFISFSRSNLGLNNIQYTV